MVGAGTKSLESAMRAQRSAKKTNKSTAVQGVLLIKGTMISGASQLRPGTQISLQNLMMLNLPVSVDLNLQVRGTVVQTACRHELFQ